MMLELNKDEAVFLDAQLTRHAEELQRELASTASFRMQHELAADIRALESIRDRLRSLSNVTTA